MLAAGEFATSDSTAIHPLRRFANSGEVDPEFHVELDSGATVHALASFADGGVVAFGDFTRVNGVPRSRLVTFRGDGSLDSNVGSGAELNGAVQFARPRSQGGLFVAGSFSTVDGVTRHGLAALRENGALDPTFAPELPEEFEVSALTALADGGVIVGGPQPSEPHLSTILRFNSAGEMDEPFPLPTHSTIRIDQLAEDSHGRIVAAFSVLESASGVQATYSHLQRFLPNGDLDTTLKLGSGTSAPVDSLLLESDESLLISGGINRIDDLPASAVARLRFDRDRALPSLLFNISTRGRTASGADVLIAGFIVAGTTPKTILLRGVGPSLAEAGISDPVDQPILTLFEGQDPVAYNKGWAGWQEGRGYIFAGTNASIFGQQTGAPPLQSPADTALVATLQPGPYTVHVTPAESSGVTLLEVFDVNALHGDRRLRNISSRGRVGTGEDQLIAGFVITGNVPRRVLVRALGPTLASLDVPTPLANPVLTIMKGQQVVAANDDWNDSAPLETAFEATGAYPFPPGSKDSALVLTLPPGAYTALVSSADSSTGIALVEVYDYP